MSSDLAKIPNLTELVLAWSQITDAGVKDLVNTPPHLEKLKDLELDHSPITDACIPELAKLKGLDISLPRQHPGD